MPELPFTYAPISQRVADRVFDGVTLCQIATWDTINVRVAGGSLLVEIGFQVNYFGVLDTGLPGNPVPAGKGISGWPQTLYANNDCAVYLNPANAADPRNGEVLYYHMLTATGDAWEHRAADGTRTTLVGGLPAAPEPCIRQGDAFALAMENPLNLAQLIRYHLNAANQPPYSKFA